MRLFPKCQNNSVQVTAFVWKGLSGNASELSLICSWLRNQAWKEDIVPMKASEEKGGGGGGGGGRQPFHYLGKRNLVVGSSNLGL